MRWCYVVSCAGRMVPEVAWLVLLAAVPLLAGLLIAVFAPGAGPDGDADGDAGEDLAARAASLRAAAARIEPDSPAFAIRMRREADRLDGGQGG